MTSPSMTSNAWLELPMYLWDSLLAGTLQLLSQSLLPHHLFPNFFLTTVTGAVNSYLFLTLESFIGPFYPSA